MRGQQVATDGCDSGCSGLRWVPRRLCPAWTPPSSTPPHRGGRHTGAFPGTPGAATTPAEGRREASALSCVPRDQGQNEGQLQIGSSGCELFYPVHDHPPTRLCCSLSIRSGRFLCTLFFFPRGEFYTCSWVDDHGITSTIGNTGRAHRVVWFPGSGGWVYVYSTRALPSSW